jgi:hypothetical protein
MLREQILRVIAEQPGIGVDGISSLVGGSTKNAMRAYITKLREEGLIEGFGRYRVAEGNRAPTRAPRHLSEFIPPPPLSRLMAGR